MIAHHLIALFVSVATASTALADEGELQLSVAPTFELLARHQRLNRGGGVDLRAAYGLRDWLAVELSAGCERFISLRDEAYTYAGEAASLYYDVNRCAVVPSVSLRYGNRFELGVTAGVGYRFEQHSKQEVVTAGEPEIRLARPANNTVHDGVVTGRLSLDYRAYDWLAVGAFVGASLPLLRRAPEMSLSGGVGGSILFYP